MNWLSTLPLHHYESMEGKLTDTSPMARAHLLAEEAAKETATPAQENLGSVHQSMTMVGQEITTSTVEISTTVAVEKSTPVAVQDSTTTAVQDSTTLDNVQLLVNDQV